MTVGASPPASKALKSQAVEPISSERTENPGVGGTLRADDWPGNVRELEAVVKRAMGRRRVGWVMREDIILARLWRSQNCPVSPRPGIDMTFVHEEALRVATSRGEVQRADLIARCGVSRETARRALVELERAGMVTREGGGRGTRYTMRVQPT